MFFSPSQPLTNFCTESFSFRDISKTARDIGKKNRIKFVGHAGQPYPGGHPYPGGVNNPTTAAAELRNATPYLPAGSAKFGVIM